MPRKVLHSHAIHGRTVQRREYTSGAPFYTADTLCGEGSGFPKGDTAEAVLEYNRKATCPACAKRYGKAKLAKLGGRVAVEPWELSEAELAERGYTAAHKPFRSAWRVLIDGVHRAYLINEKGFGTLWEVRQLKKPSRGYGFTGAAVGAAYRRNESESDGVWPIHRASRESAAAHCLALFEAGRLPTLAEMESADKAEAERKQAAEEARAKDRAETLAAVERTRAEREERLTEARLGLAALAERPDLSNLEAAGLASARKLLGLA